MTDRRCRLCGNKLREGMYRCESCYTFTFGDEGTPEYEHRRPVVRLLSEVPYSKYSRLETRIIDGVLGGGLVTTNVVLLAGWPGAGKSTLALQISECVGVKTLYVSAEESEGEVRARGERLRLRGMSTHIHICDAMTESPDYVFNAIDQTAPKLVVVDSLPGVSTRDDEQDNIRRSLKDYAKRHHCPIIVLDHVTKEEDFAGRMSLAHGVDVLLSFTGKNEEVRILESQKNRAGKAPNVQRFRHTETGLIEVLVENGED